MPFLECMVIITTVVSTINPMDRRIVQFDKGIAVQGRSIPHLPGKGIFLQKISLKLSSLGK